jgi:hypothetical protein
LKEALRESNSLTAASISPWIKSNKKKY